MQSQFVDISLRRRRGVQVCRVAIKAITHIPGRQQIQRRLKERLKFTINAGSFETLSAFKDRRTLDYVFGTRRGQWLKRGCSVCL